MNTAVAERSQQGDASGSAQAAWIVGHLEFSPIGTLVRCRVEVDGEAEQAENEDVA